MSKQKNENFEMPEKLWNFSFDEQETLISFSRGENFLTIFTTDNLTFNKLKKLLSEEKSEYKILKVDYLKNSSGEKVPCSVTVQAPLKCLSLRTGKRKEMSEEQKDILRERMKGLKKKD